MISIPAPLKEPMYLKTGAMSRAWVQYFQQALDDIISVIINNIYVNQNTITVTGNYTLTSDYYVVKCNSSSAMALTLPSAASMTNKYFIIYGQGAGNVTVTPVGSETISGDSNFVLRQNECIPIVSNGTEWIIF